MTRLRHQKILHKWWVLCLLFALSSLAQGQDWVYATVKGDNLWSISKQYLDSTERYRQLVKLNGIKNPNNLLPGAKIRIPLKWIRSNVVPAKIMAVEGKAILTGFLGKTTRVSSGDQVNMGDTLQTLKHSTVAVQFADDSVLTLHADSMVRFDHLSAHGTTGMVDTRLRLVRGRVETRTTPASGPGSRFEIKTPSAISAVRGTRYRASVLDQGNASAIEVIHGSVAVEAADSKELVPGGFGTRTEKSRPPLPPLRLLPTPAYRPIPASIRETGYVIHWDHVRGASSYRTEISADKAFYTVLWEHLGERPEVALPKLEDGNYFLRTRAIDELNLEGLNATARLNMDTQPQPPVQLQPWDKAVFRGTSPEFKWTDSKQANSYRLEISRTASFDELAVNETSLTRPHYQGDTLTNPGTYYWRLTSIDREGKTGPRGVSRQFQIKPETGAVEATIGIREDNQLVAKWTKDQADRKYQVQIATVEDFTDLQIDRITEAAEFTFEPVAWQNRYLRVRIIEEDGHVGPWSTVHKIAGTTDDSWLLLLLPLFLALM